MKRFFKFWPFVLIGLIVLIFFLPVFKGRVPFPGDLLINSNPYRTESFLGYSPGGYPSKDQGPDVINEIYPWRYFSVNQIKNLSIPFWNPHNFSGNPQLANFQTGIFYPLNFLYLLLPFNVSWTLLIMLQPFLAGIFMFLFLKKGIGLKDFSSFIGGLAFSFSSYMTVWIEYGNIGHTILWLPLVLLFTKLYFKKESILNFLGILIPLFFSLLAGYIQGVFYIYIICFFYYAYLLYLEKKLFKNHKKSLFFLLSLLLPILITAFQIIPTLKIFSFSTRGAYDLNQIEKNLSPLFNLITIFFPDFFGNPAVKNYWLDGTYIERVMYPGTLILFFVLYSLINKINFLEKKFFIFISFISLIIATNLPLIKYFYLIPIPVISTTVATREFSIFIFSAIILGAIGLNHFLEEKNNKKSLIYFYFVFLIIVWLTTLLLSKIYPNISGSLKVSQHNLIIPTILSVLTVTAYLIKNKIKNVSLLLIILIMFFDLFYFFNKITPFSPQELIYPNTPIISYLNSVSGINRFWGYGSSYIQSNFQSVDGTFSPEGNDPLHISRYGELLASSKNGQLPKVLPRPDANIAPGFGADDLRNNFYRKRILDLLGVKYILNKQELVDSWKVQDLSTFPESEYKLIKKIYPWQVYDNNSALPRFFIASKYIVAKNKNDALSFIYNKNINLKDTIILEKNPEIKIGLNSSSAAKLIFYKPNQVEISTVSKDNSLLFLSDSYYPEWSVKIDGIKKELLIADYSFRAVAVPKGSHVVLFYYEPNSFSLGLAVSSLGIIGLFFTLFYVKNNKKIS